MKRFLTVLAFILLMAGLRFECAAIDAFDASAAGSFAVPEEAVEAASERVLPARREATPAFRVIYMLSPVSPSGMGNTFKSLITVFSLPRAAAPSRSMAVKVKLSNSVVLSMVFYSLHYACKRGSSSADGKRTAEANRIS